MSEIPLTLPEDYNPETYLIRKVTENGVFHESRRGARLAADLVANGAPEDLALAHKVLDAVLACQERHESDPHYGNFMWMAEDDVVQDLNAVEFNLEHLIPMMLQHADRLSPEMQDRVLTAIRLGLDEIRRLDVLVVYTNITLLDILNTCLGGELLGDAAIAERGYQKLVAWMAFTDQYGIPFEYNSPSYSVVSIRALSRLAKLVDDADTRIRARTALARLALSAALHIHAGTGRWAGPHSRAYQPSVVCETDPEVTILRSWIADGTLPDWVGDVLDSRGETFQITETAMPDRNLGITTYHTPAFALGVSATQAGGQSDVMICHYGHTEEACPGVFYTRTCVFYTRYLTNDKWLGDFYHATDRTKSRNLVEEGRFYGVQQGARAIGLYTIGRTGVIDSAKAAYIWTHRELIDEIWVGERRIASLPADVPPGEVVVVGAGDAWFAVRPLTRTDLGRDAPIHLVERQGDLVLELYNYSGPAKSFWELGWPGAFFHGHPQCGIYLEVAQRDAYDDGCAFAKVVARGSFVDEAPPPFTYAGERERPWTVAYERDGETLGIEVDLMAWALKRRWTQDGDIGWPMLASPMAQESRSGHITIGDATLTWGEDADHDPGPAWLFASPETDRYVAAYHGTKPVPLTLVVPQGAVEIAAMATGVVLWDRGTVSVDAVDLQGAPTVISEA
jgi:hypothetical protein